MRNPPTNEELAQIPRLETTKSEKVENRRMYDIYRLQNKSWYVAEYSPETRTFYGYVVDHKHLEKGAWEYFSLDGLLRLRNEWGTEVIADSYHGAPRIHVPAGRT